LLAAAGILMRLGIPVGKDFLEIADYPVLTVGISAEAVAAMCMDRGHTHRVVVVA
jgi:hypothetical protein